MPKPSSQDSPIFASAGDGARCWGSAMDGFDFLFAPLSLRLGLAMAEVLGEFARVMKLHAPAAR